MSRPLTGRDVAWVMGGGFAVVVAVNLVLVVASSRSFTGLVVPNGYVASQDFNRWLAAGRAQAALHWKPDLVADGGRLRLLVDGPGRQPVTGLSARVRLSHPVAAGAPIQLDLVEGPAGTYSGALAVPPGAWNLALELEDAAGHRHVSTRRIEVAP